MVDDILFHCVGKYNYIIKSPTWKITFPICIISIRIYDKITKSKAFLCLLVFALSINNE